MNILDRFAARLGYFKPCPPAPRFGYPNVPPPLLPDVVAINRRADMMAYLIQNYQMSGDQAWQYMRAYAQARGVTL